MALFGPDSGESADVGQGKRGANSKLSLSINHIHRVPVLEAPGVSRHYAGRCFHVLTKAVGISE